MAAAASALHLQQPFLAAHTQLIVGILCCAAAQQQPNTQGGLGAILLEYGNLGPFMHSNALLLCICLIGASRPDSVCQMLLTQAASLGHVSNGTQA